MLVQCPWLNAPCWHVFLSEHHFMYDSTRLAPHLPNNDPTRVERGSSPGGEAELEGTAAAPHREHTRAIMREAVLVRVGE